MPQYQITLQRTHQIVVESQTLVDAEQVAKTLVARDPDTKLLSVIDVDVLQAQQEGRVA